MRYRIRRKRRWPRIGVSGAAALLTLAIAAGGAFILNAMSTDPALEELVEHARENGRSPLELAARAARGNRLLFVADVPGIAAPKHLVASMIEALSEQPGLDAVALEIPSNHQPVIDRYLETGPENTGILLSTPGLVPEVGGSAQPYLAIFQTVWRVNQELGADRRIRIIAVDLPGWPPGASVSPSQAVKLFGERDAYMAGRIDAEVLRREPRARLLAFLGGLHVLTEVRPRIIVGGADPVTPTPLAARLMAEYPGEVYSILLDGSPRSAAYHGIVAYTATGAYELFRRGLDGRSFALPVNDRFDALSRPLRGASAPGILLGFAPEDHELSNAAHGYVFLGAVGRR